MRILGIDPGFERVGIAVLEKENNKNTLLYSDCFKTNSSLSFYERITKIGKEIKTVLEKYSPEVFAIETLFFNNNQKTAMYVSESRGVIIYEAAQKNLDICEYTPLQIKNAVTGYGRADKNQINTMVKQLVSINKEIKSDDEMDAIAVCLTCSASYKPINI
jgi:crossover junction endodeoxyribonuclease RuvC